MAIGKPDLLGCLRTVKLKTLVLRKADDYTVPRHTFAGNRPCCKA